MEEFALKYTKTKILFIALITLFTTTLFAGCNEEQEQTQQARKAQVKAMKVIQRDTPLTSEFAGQIMAADEVKVQSKVSGNVVEKYVTGGQFVSEGQPLYKIDSRQYESAVLKARADLAQSEATLNNARIDLYRDQKLLEDEAIAEQVVTTQLATVRAYEATKAANEALLQTAMDNLEEAANRLVAYHLYDFDDNFEDRDAATLDLFKVNTGVYYARIQRPKRNIIDMDNRYTYYLFTTIEGQTLTDEPAGASFLDTHKFNDNYSRQDYYNFLW